MEAPRIRALIIDDEPLARKRIRTFLVGEREVDVIGECGDGAEAIDVIRREAPDLLFLDIQMPEIDGFGVLEAVRNGRLPAVVFTTAYDKYALQAFEIHAIDYLLKPFDEERFRRALGRAKLEVRREKSDTVGEKLEKLLDQLKSEKKYIDRILVKAQGRVFFLKVAEVDWIEAAGNYLKLHVGRDCHLIRETMNELEGRIDPARFVRIHRSTIVSLDRIKELQPFFSGDYVVVLTDGTKLRLARGQRKKLEELLGESL